MVSMEESPLRQYMFGQRISGIGKLELGSVRNRIYTCCSLRLKISREKLFLRPRAIVTVLDELQKVGNKNWVFEQPASAAYRIGPDGNPFQYALFFREHDRKNRAFYSGSHKALPQPVYGSGGFNVKSPERNQWRASKKYL